jgi:hypothetical protein
MRKEKMAAWMPLLQSNPVGIGGVFALQKLRG